jgi:hypothetical protein
LGDGRLNRRKNLLWVFGVQGKLFGCKGDNCLIYPFQGVELPLDFGGAVGAVQFL